ncbi:MAG: flavodoxin family protein [Ruminococcaceae bacterium]|nr:flavodoxin family protein [Oscillospiraceae bacterium]
MKALLICGSPNEKGCTYTALAEIEKTLCKNGIETEIYQIGKKPISGCMACKACYKLGKCAINDNVNAIAARLDEFDAIVIGSPVYYAAANGTLTAFLDRLFYSAGRKMAGKVGAAIVSCRRGGASAAFDQLNKYFGISNMVVATSQYWNQVHGNTAEEVVQDGEGMQTMRSLGENIAWLLRLIECGKQNGIEPPKYDEAKIRTNFIR